MKKTILILLLLISTWGCNKARQVQQKNLDAVAKTRNVLDISCSLRGEEFLLSTNHFNNTTTFDTVGLCLLESIEGVENFTLKTGFDSLDLTHITLSIFLDQNHEYDSYNVLYFRKNYFFEEVSKKVALYVKETHTNTPCDTVGFYSKGKDLFIEVDNYENLDVHNYLFTYFFYPVNQDTIKVLFF